MPATSPLDGSVSRSAFASELSSRTDWADGAAVTVSAVEATINRRMRFMRASLCGRRRRLLPAQQDLLHAPRRDLGDVDLVGIAAIHLVDAAELLEAVTRLAKPAEDLAIELHLVDLAGRRHLVEVVAG